MRNPVERTIQDLYSLSPLQSQILECPASSAGAVSQSIREFSSLDIQAFEQAWRMMLERHPILRTSVHQEGISHPVQVVHSHVTLSLERYDWRSVSLSDCRRRVDSLAAEERQRGFDLFKPPLMRFVLVQVADLRYLLLWTWHALILDQDAACWAFREWQQHYTARLQSVPTHLPPAIPYREYVAWTQSKLPDAESYWRQQLGRGIQPTPLEARNRNTDSSAESKPLILQVSLGAKRTDLIRGLAERAGGHVTTVILAAWSLLLSRYRGCQAVATAIRMRPLPPHLSDQQLLLGPATVTLPLILDVPDEDDILTFIANLQAQVDRHRRHGFVSEMHLRQWGGVSQQEPLFESVLVLDQPSDQTSPTLFNLPSGFSWSIAGNNAEVCSAANAAITLTVINDRHGIKLKAIANPRWLSERNASQCLDDLELILARMEARGRHRVVDLAPIKRGFAPCVIPLQARGKKTPLICVHPAGGQVWCYGALGQLLSSDRPLLALEAEELTTKATPLKSVEDLASRYVHRITSILPRGPYLLGGWSFGGFVAYEMARKLQREGQDVAQLALLDCLPPTGQLTELLSPSDILLRFGHQLGLRLPTERLRNLPPKRLIRLLWKRAIAKMLIPAETSLDDFTQQANLYQAHIHAMRAYRPVPYSGPVTVFLAEKGQRHNRGTWDGLVNHLETIRVPGGHVSMLREPYVRTLANRLQTILQTRP